TTDVSLAVVAAIILFAPPMPARSPAAWPVDLPDRASSPADQPLLESRGIDLLGAPGGPYPNPATDAPTPAPFGGPIGERPKVTCDWFGARTGLRDRGILVDVSTTQFYQGVATGGLDRSFRYGGRNDYFGTLDGEKLGLWEGFFIKLHGETRYGQSANFST